MAFISICVVSFFRILLVLQKVFIVNSNEAVFTWLPIGLCHRLCIALMTSTGLYCPSVIYAVFLCDPDHPLFLVILSSAAYHYDRHDRTMIYFDDWLLKVNAPDIPWGCQAVDIHIRLFCALWMICQASSLHCLTVIHFSVTQLFSPILSLVWGLRWAQAVKSGTNWNVDSIFLFDFCSHHKPTLQ